MNKDIWEEHKKAKGRIWKIGLLLVAGLIAAIIAAASAKNSPSGRYFEASKKQEEYAPLLKAAQSAVEERETDLKNLEDKVAREKKRLEELQSAISVEK